jgi:phosphomannomutase
VRGTWLGTRRDRRRLQIHRGGNAQGELRPRRGRERWHWISGHIPERDGILAGLLLLELLATEKKTINALIARLEKEFGPHRYARIDTHYPVEKRGR